MNRAAWILLIIAVAAILIFDTLGIIGRARRGETRYDVPANAPLPVRRYPWGYVTDAIGPPSGPGSRRLILNVVNPPADRQISVEARAMSVLTAVARSEPGKPLLFKPSGDATIMITLPEKLPPEGVIVDVELAPVR